MPPTAEPTAAQTRTDSPPCPRPRVLLVEDDEDLALGISIALSKSFDVEVANCSRDALAAYAAGPPDVLLLDYELPDQNGIRLFETLRRRSDAEVPAIMISAYTSREDAAEHAGFSGFVEKPFDTHRLVWEIERALDRGPQAA